MTEPVGGLSHLGFSEFFAIQLADAKEGLVPARVVGQHRRQWDVMDEAGVRRASLAGRLWDPEKGSVLDLGQPTVGDWVLLRDSEQELPVIESILERRTSLVRAAGGRQRQVLVANVDFVAIVVAFTRPQSSDASARRSLQLRRIERYVAGVRQGGAEPLVVLNKADLVEAPWERAETVKARLGDVQVVPTHCKSHEGIASLTALLAPGQTIGFVGLSGVGKSSLVNLMSGSDHQRTASERTADARGRHTTTHRALFETPGGIWLIDTPGMREFALADASTEDLQAFSDIATCAERCRFRDCEHRREPGCAVREAVEAGTLSLDRVSNYQTLLEELKQDEKSKTTARGQRLRRGRPPTSPDEWDDD